MKIVEVDIDKLNPAIYNQGSSHYWSGIRSLGDIFNSLQTSGEQADDLLGKHILLDNISCDIWEFAKPKQNKEHPTMKPIELVGRAIKHSSKPREFVLDTFGGSGSTLIACEQLNRSCYMMELDPYYCSVIIERWENLTGKTHLKIN